MAYVCVCVPVHQVVLTAVPEWQICLSFLTCLPEQVIKSTTVTLNYENKRKHGFLVESYINGSMF